MKLKSRLDLTEVFCDVDDFYQSFEQYCRPIPQLTAIADGEWIQIGKHSLASICIVPSSRFAPNSKFAHYQFKKSQNS